MYRSHVPEVGLTEQETVQVMLSKGEALYLSIHKQTRSLPRPGEAVGSQKDQDKHTAGRLTSSLVKEHGWVNMLPGQHPESEGMLCAPSTAADLCEVLPSTQSCFPA